MVVDVSNFQCNANGLNEFKLMYSVHVFFYYEFLLMELEIECGMLLAP